MGNICHGENRVKIAEEPVVIEYEDPDVITEQGSTFSLKISSNSFPICKTIPIENKL